MFHDLFLEHASHRISACKLEPVGSAIAGLSLEEFHPTLVAISEDHPLQHHLLRPGSNTMVADDRGLASLSLLKIPHLLSSAPLRP